MTEKAIASNEDTARVVAIVNARVVTETVKENIGVLCCADTIVDQYDARIIRCVIVKFPSMYWMCIMAYVEAASVSGLEN